MIITRKFGVTFHDKMDVKTIYNQWQKVSPEIKAANPGINAQMEAANILNSGQKTLVDAEKTASDAFQVVREVSEAAAATLTGNVTYPTLKAAKIVAEGIQEAETSSLQSIKETLLGLLQ